MNSFQKWINQYKFELYTISFLLILIPSAALFSAARGGSEAWIWALLAMVGFGNLLAIAIP